VSQIERSAGDSRRDLGQLLDPINRTKEDSKGLNLHPACRLMRRQPDRGPAAATAAGRPGDRGGKPRPDFPTS
jgi:hypothetical protein